MVLEQWDMHMQKMNLDKDLILFTKISSKWIIDINVKCTIMKLLFIRNIGENLDDIGFDDDFLDTILKA